MNSTGSEAIKMVNDATGDNPYDLIFMDWMMPVMNGIDAAIAIHEQLGEGAPKIILVTAYGYEEAKEQSVDIELSSILTKPVSASTLLDSILESQGRAVTTRSRQSNVNEEASEAKRRLRGAHLLLVEDNEDLRKHIIKFLEGYYSVLFADNGVQGLEMLKTQNVQLVISDVMMPVMDGFEFCLKIKSQIETSHIPVI